MIKKDKLKTKLPLAAIPAVLASEWISGEETPSNAKDVIVKIANGTFFMAKYHPDKKMDFLFFRLWIESKRDYTNESCLLASITKSASLHLTAVNL